MKKICPAFTPAFPSLAWAGVQLIFVSTSRYCKTTSFSIQHFREVTYSK
ncbi:hypothetical protein HHL16_15095 [Pseudoflavitalea sp. G-6-1-2]|nr:hypothetical protein [Pseudoflavitalea sp. G-6-1-2]NML22208.1 hypothetical protein [Pseudoflavitalea sp. G-6-1-2]